MTIFQIAWASQYDWFIADLGDGSILVDDECDETIFDNYTMLRRWAGY